MKNFILDKATGNTLTKSSDTRKTYELSFGGLPFKLRSSHDEKTVRELSHFVEQKLQEALVATKSGSFQSAAVLAALNIAEELILLKRRALNELERIEERAQKISNDLEQSKSQSTGNSRVEVKEAST